MTSGFAGGGGTASNSRTGSAHASSTNLPTLDEGSLHLDDNEEACVDQMVLQLPDFMTAADADAIQVRDKALHTALQPKFHSSSVVGMVSKLGSTLFCFFSPSRGLCSHSQMFCAASLKL